MTRNEALTALQIQCNRDNVEGIVYHWTAHSGNAPNIVRYSVISSDIKISDVAKIHGKNIKILATARPETNP